MKNIKPIRFNEHIAVHNKQEFEIEYVDGNRVHFTDGTTFLVQTIDKYFQPNFARTIDSFQGDKNSAAFWYYWSEK